MSASLVKLNQVDVIPQLTGNGVNKLLKFFSIEALVFLTKMPAAQWFYHAIEPKIVTLPEYGCYRFHRKGHNYFPVEGFESQTSLALAQVTQPLSLSKPVLIG
jgi:hypothetical protein